MSLSDVEEWVALAMGQILLEKGQRRALHHCWQLLPGFQKETRPP